MGRKPRRELKRGWIMGKGKKATAAAVLALMLGLGVTPALAQQSGAQAQAAQLEALGKRPDELFKQGKYAEALAAAEEFAKAVEQDETAWGNPGTDTAAALNSVVWNALFAKRFERALEAGDRATALASSYSNPSYLSIQGNRAYALMFLGRAKEALAAYVEHKGEVMASSKKWEDVLFEDFAEFQKHGLDHPLMARVREALAAAPEAPENPRSLWQKSMDLVGENKKSEAISLLRKYVEAVKTSRGESHPDYATAIGTLGQILDHDHQPKDAEPLLRKALALDEQHFSPEHPQLADDLDALAFLLNRTNRSGEAEKLYHRALSIAEKRYGPEHSKVANVLSSLASLSSDLNRFADAEAFYRRALAIEEKQYGADSRRIAGTLTLFGLLLKKLDKFAESETMLKRSLEINEKTRGAEHPYVASSLNALASLYQQTSRLTEAEALMRRALAIDEKNFGAYHDTVATRLKTLASILHENNHLSEAEQALRRALAIFEKVYGPESPSVTASLNNLALILEDANRIGEAESLFRQTMAINEKLNGLDPTDLNNLAGLLARTDRLAEAETMARRALAITEKNYGADHTSVAGGLNNLGFLLKETNRYAEAEQLYHRALAIDEKHYGLEHPNVSIRLNNLASLFMAAKRFAEAEPLFRRALAIDEKSYGREHPRVATHLNNLGLLLMKTDRLGEAESMLSRALAISEKSYGSDHPDVATNLINLSRILHNTKRLGEVERLILRALIINKNSYGPNHSSVALSFSNLAVLDVRRGDWPGALRNERRSTEILIAGAQRMRGQSGAEKRQLALSVEQFKDHAVMAFRAASHAAFGDASVRDEAFALAQRVAANQASGALAQASARFAGGNDALAALAREQQDLARQGEAVDKRLLAALGKADNEAAGTARAEQVKIDARLKEIAAQLEKDHPDYVALVNPEPLTVAQTQALLAPDEAFVQFLDVEANSLSPIPETAFAFVITKAQALWLELPLGAKALGDRVAALRCGLDSGAWKGTSSRCGELLGKAAPGDDLPPFNLTRAHGLYRDLFGQAEDLIRNKRLLIAPSGALTQLPFQVLVTEAPDASAKGADAYAKARWLGARNAISVLPSAASLKLLRMGKQGSASDPFLGFGNPLLNGGGDRSAWNKQACAKTTAPQGVKRSVHRAAPPALNDVYRGAVANVEMLRQSTPLPETADELCAVAHNLGAPDSSVYLGERATVSQIKALSASGALGRARAIHFATHGLVAGETALFLRNRAEPALLMTPPAQDKVTPEDDGLLKASDVTQLKLNADWVVMSACNTAAGGEGGEALSGLARAFFYAGARSMLVSHWYVDSSAAVEITTGAFSALKANPGIGRDEALRRSLSALIAKGGDSAHPSVWAPFVLVGDGGRTTSLQGVERTAPASETPTRILKLDGAGKQTIAALTFSPDGRRLLGVTQDAGITLWDAQTGASIRKLTSGGANKVFGSSADGRLLATASGSRTEIILWDAERDQRAGAITASGGVRFSRDAVALSPDGLRLAAEHYGASSSSPAIGVWDVHTGKLARLMDGRINDVHALVFSPDGRRLAVIDAKGALAVWNAETGKPMLPAIVSAAAKLAAFSPDGRVLASAGAGREIKLWDAQTGRQTGVIASQAETIGALAFSPDGGLLAVAENGTAEFLGAVSTVAGQSDRNPSR
jgi:CHAT domain-containing protein/tetratricopeptide (TPR) repeat protein